MKLPVGRPDPKKRPDYKEETTPAQRLAASISGLGDEAEAAFDLGARDAGQALGQLRVALEVAIVQKRDAAAAADQDGALVVQERLQRFQLASPMINQALCVVVRDQR